MTPFVPLGSVRAPGRSFVLLECPLRAGDARRIDGTPFRTPGTPLESPRMSFVMMGGFSGPCDVPSSLQDVLRSVGKSFITVRRP